MKRNGMRVVDCYTRAIFSAPIDSGELLGMAHANRAAALIALDYHKVRSIRHNVTCEIHRRPLTLQEAYFDCKLARQHSYPKSKLIKVLWRQATCSMKLQNLDQLINDLNEIDGILDELKIRHLHEDKSGYMMIYIDMTGWHKLRNHFEIHRATLFSWMWNIEGKHQW